MRILLADDDENIRSALGLLLEQEPDVHVVGEIVHAHGLIDLFDAQTRCCTEPGVEYNGVGYNGVEYSGESVLLLDWELPGWMPELHLKALRAHCPRLKVIALSVGPDARQAALAAGVDAFLCKSDPPDQVLQVVRQVTADGDQR